MKTFLHEKFQIYSIPGRTKRDIAQDTW